MATTVSYKNNTLTTVGFNGSATLNTQSTWLEDDITINVDALNLQSLTVTPTDSTQIFSDNYIIGSPRLLMISWWNASNMEKTLSPTLIAGNKYYYVYKYGTESQSLSGTMSTTSGTFIASTNYVNINNNCQIKTTSAKLLEYYFEGYVLEIYEYTEFDGYLPVTINPIPSNYIVPTGTLQISGTGTYDVSSYASAEVTAPGVVNNQNKTVTPTETQQTISADNGYTGLGTVTINAISNTYVGSGIITRTQNDLTFNYDYGEWFVDVPSGYYANSYYKTIPSGSAATPATTITTTPTISVNASGLITVTANATQSITPTISAGYVSSGTAGTITVNGSNTSQLSTQAATTITPTTSSQTAVAAGKYTTGAVTVAAIPANYIDSSLLQIYYTGSSEPSGNLGNNGDLYFQTVE